MSEPNAPLLAVNDLHVTFRVRRGWFGRRSFVVRAVNGISFEIHSGETFGLVGESGSGKSTVGRALLKLVDAERGDILLNGRPVAELRGRMLDFRRDLQVVFQDPYASLNPTKVIGDIVGEPLLIHGLVRTRAERESRVAELLTQVGLAPELMERYASEFSGGQRQRIAVARALALSPKLIVCDEPVSALDVSTQSQVVNLLEELQQTLGLAYLFIAHDLAVVRHLSHRIGVMYLGRLVEVGPAERLYESPAHPYTKMLLAAIPVPNPEEQRVRKAQRRLLPVTELPSPTNVPSGCAFHQRCPHAQPLCRTDEPVAKAVPGGGSAACHLIE